MSDQPPIISKGVGRGRRFFPPTENNSNGTNGTQTPVPTPTMAESQPPPFPKTSIGRGRALLTAQKIEPVSSASSIKSMGRGALLRHLASTSDSGLSEPTQSDCIPTGITTPTAGFSSGYGRGVRLSVGASSHRSETNLAEPMPTAAFKEMVEPAEPKKIEEKPLSETMKSLKIYEKPTHPVIDKGNQGESTTVVSNYLKLEFIEKKGVFYYSVYFKPDIDSSQLKRAFVKQKLPLKRGIRCFDGGAILYLPDRLDMDEKIFVCEHPNDGSRVEMIVTFKRAMSLGECSTLFGTLVQNCLKELRLTRLGRQNYNSKAAHHIPEYSLQIWPGYETSVEEKEDGIYLYCDLLHRVLRFQTVYSLLKEISQKNPGNFQSVAAKELLGASVLTHYNNRLYRVDDIAWNLSPLDTFTLSTGEKISYKEYYKKSYNVDIADSKQPLIVSKAKKRRLEDENETLLLLVPELCQLTGITEQMRSDFRVMKRISTYTRLTPQQRIDGLKGFVKSLRENENVCTMLEEWGLRIPNEPTVLPARIIPSPMIEFGKDQKVPANADWGRAVRSSPVYRSVDITKWIIIHHQRDDRRAKTFLRFISQVGKALNVVISEPTVLPIQNDRIDVVVRTLTQEVTSDMEMVVVIMSNPREDVYGAIKKFCTHDRGIPSQVILSNTLSKEDKVRPIVQNIALQMIAKCGGALWKLPIPMKKTMVCGIDTYHDPGKHDSVGAFVASIDPTFTTYFSQAAKQTPGTELIPSLQRGLFNALEQFLVENSVLPDRIIVFRDGVSESVMPLVLNNEVNQFERACQSFNQAYKPKIVFIVVLKRIGIRYFAPEGRNTVTNAKPGTVLDHTVTKRYWRDYMIVSQLVRHGTAAPTQYVVIRDDAEMKIDVLQKLTYYFCHMYYNWPGTVRVPAPCLYAHKLAYAVGQYIRKAPHEALRTRLHYL